MAAGLRVGEASWRNNIVRERLLRCHYYRGRAPVRRA